MADYSDRYPNGYVPKINYWTKKAFAAKIAGEEDNFKRAKEKIKYFTKKHREIYGNS